MRQFCAGTPPSDNRDEIKTIRGGEVKNGDKSGRRGSEDGYSEDKNGDKIGGRGSKDGYSEDKNGDRIGGRGSKDGYSKDCDNVRAAYGDAYILDQYRQCNDNQSSNQSFKV